MAFFFSCVVLNNQDPALSCRRDWTSLVMAIVSVAPVKRVSTGSRVSVVTRGGWLIMTPVPCRRISARQRLRRKVREYNISMRSLAPTFSMFNSLENPHNLLESPHEDNSVSLCCGHNPRLSPVLQLTRTMLLPMRLTDGGNLIIRAKAKVINNAPPITASFSAMPAFVHHHPLPPCLDPSLGR